MTRSGSAAWLARLPLLVAAAFVALFVLLPVAAMLWHTVYGPDGLTLAALGNLMADTRDWQLLGWSLLLGVCATAISFTLGFGHTWLTLGTDLPGGRWLGPLGVAPLVVPPIFVAMAFSDLADMAGFWPCAFLLGVSHAPFVAVLTARGLRSVDGRMYEAALLARGRLRAGLLLFRTVLPEALAGCLFAFILTVSDHGVPEFLTVKGKTWHTYAEGIFSRWTRRATGATHEDVVSPIVASIPLVLLIGVALVFALRLRARATLADTARALPYRPLGRFRWPALLLPAAYLTAGIGVPVVVMARWAAGSTQLDEPMSLHVVRQSFQKAIDQGGSDLLNSILLAVGVAVLVLVVALPLAREAAKSRPWLDHLSILPVALPAILLGMGLVRTFNGEALGRVYDVVGDFYDSWGLAAAGYASRFLPFGVLTLSSVARRVPRSVDDAALLSGRGPAARALRIHLPTLGPAAWSAAILVFVLALRELDLAVVLPAANATAVRRLANAVHFQHEDWSGVLALLLLLSAVVLPLVASLILGRRLRHLS